jgi:2-hydroxychromene-2-carboxylate isomerase
VAPRTVSFFLDLISPFVWLALRESAGFAEHHGISWDVRPVVYAKLLEADGLTGPAETAAKRRYTFHDVARSAQELELRFAGPPRHPFRSLEALRTLHLFHGDPAELRLAARLSDACWREGRSLEDLGVVSDVVEDVGLDATDLERRIAEPRVKLGLREQTERAIDLGVFGVPTFALDSELFWGHDRMPALARRLEGAAPPRADEVEAFLARPRGVQRRGAPKTGA